MTVAFPLLAVAPLVVLSGCSRLKVKPEVWDAWAASYQATSGGQSGGPQYDQGTIGLTDQDPDPDQSVGSVYVWDQGGGSKREGYEATDLATLTTTSVLQVRKTADTPQRPLGTNLTEAAFDALASSTACDHSDTHCVADDTYAFGSFPASAPSQPPGVRQVFAVEKRWQDDCHGSWDVEGISAFVYRTRAEVSGQARWVEHWFVRTSDASPFRSYGPPDRCAATGVGDDELEHLQIDRVSGPTIATFHGQLKGTGCSGTPEPWCNFCGSGGSACNHTSIVLEWWQVQ